uniref:Receptor protein serine/threonine kinase n=1 Tax=Opuntia streptacantha TaxID=393608 RepID=A0A7C9A1R8_OPUST
MQNLVEWIRQYLSDKKKFGRFMDARLEGKYPSNAAVGIAELALKCLAQEPKNRPLMPEVLQTLKILRAANILVDNGFHVTRLFDFGLAKLGPIGDKARAYEGHGNLWILRPRICHE